MSKRDMILADRLRSLAARGQLRTLRTRHREAVLDFAGNDYLGLSRHPLLIERAQAWAARFGAGAGASRLVTGTHDYHLAVEEKIARLKGTQAALIFASGWQANATVLPALIAADAQPSLLFADRLNHASLHHGCAAARVRQIRFRHNDLDHLEQLLEERADQPGTRTIITESVFSMDGDRADIARLGAIATRHDAFLYLDEAHATGVLGPGGGGLSALAPGAVDLVMGTFSKALGGFGAYVAGSRTLIEYLVNSASGFIYTTAPPPAVLGAIDAALDLLPTLDAERARLMRLAEALRCTLRGKGIDVGQSTTQIVPVMVGAEADALALSEALAARDIIAIAIRPPTVPPGGSRLRIALSCTHGDADVERLAHAIIAHHPVTR